MDETTTPDVGPFPIGAQTIWTRRAIDALHKGRPGETITADEMAQIIGRDCRSQDKGYTNVTSAIRHCLTHYEILWQWQRGEDHWKCLNDEERVAYVLNQNKRAFRASGRTLKVAATIDETKLSDAVRGEYQRATVTTQVIRLCGSSPFRKRLANHQGAKLTQPDVGRLIELMQK